MSQFWITLILRECYNCIPKLWLYTPEHIWFSDYVYIRYSILFATSCFQFQILVWTGTTTETSLSNLMYYRERLATKHQWSSGRIVPCHGTEPGSIPGWCIPFELCRYGWAKVGSFVSIWQHSDDITTILSSFIFFALRFT